MKEWKFDSLMPFGKHKGKKLSELRFNYVSWLLCQGWFKGELRNFLEANKYWYWDVSSGGGVLRGAGDMMSGYSREGY